MLTQTTLKTIKSTFLAEKNRAEARFNLDVGRGLNSERIKCRDTQPKRVTLVQSNAG